MQYFTKLCSTTECYPLVTIYEQHLLALPDTINSSIFRLRGLQQCSCPDYMIENRRTRELTVLQLTDCLAVNYKTIIYNL